MNDRQLIREQVSVPEAVDMLDLGPVDGQGKIFCPLHEELTPSFHVYEDHFKCFGCGLHGDVVWLVARVAGIPLWKAEQFLLGSVDELATGPRVEHLTREPVDLTAKMADLQAPEGFVKAWDHAQSTVTRRWPYLQWGTAELFGVAAARDGGLLFPHYSPDYSHIVGIKHRTVQGDKTSVKGSTFTLGPYLGWVGPGPRWPVILCEGEPDTLCMWQAMFDRQISVVGLPSGAGAYPDSVHDFLTHSPSTVYLALDNDPAGVAAQEKIGIRLSEVGIVVCNISGQFSPHKDVADALAGGWKPELR